MFSFQSGVTVAVLHLYWQRTPSICIMSSLIVTAFIFLHQTSPGLRAQASLRTHSQWDCRLLCGSARNIELSLRGKKSCQVFYTRFCSCNNYYAFIDSGHSTTSMQTLATTFILYFIIFQNNKRKK